MGWVPYRLCIWIPACSVYTYTVNTKSALHWVRPFSAYCPVQILSFSSIVHTLACLDRAIYMTYTLSHFLVAFLFRNESKTVWNWTNNKPVGLFVHTNIYTDFNTDFYTYYLYIIIYIIYINTYIFLYIIPIQFELNRVLRLKLIMFPTYMRTFILRQSQKRSLERWKCKLTPIYADTYAHKYRILVKIK